MINSYFEMMGISKPVYLDLGSNHPIETSNTYFFSRRGCTGICVDPNPELIPLYRKFRPHDTLLTAGIGPEDTTGDYYVMSSDVLSTTDAEEAKKMSEDGSHTLSKVLKIQMLTINTVIKEHLRQVPNFVSLDTETDDLAIMKQFDLENARPEIFCVETLEYSVEQIALKKPDILKFMDAQNYQAVADTWINTIFVDRLAWNRGEFLR